MLSLWILGVAVSAQSFEIALDDPPLVFTSIQNELRESATALLSKLCFYTYIYITSRLPSRALGSRASTHRLR